MKPKQVKRIVDTMFFIGCELADHGHKWDDKLKKDFDYCINTLKKEYAKAVKSPNL